MPASAPRDRGPADIVAADTAGAAMRAGRQVAPLAHGTTASWVDGGRLMLQRGTIDLIVRAGGSAPAVEGAYRALSTGNVKMMSPRAQSIEKSP